VRLQMLLRRVLDHVRDQNWFAVSLDFVIVVIGVFIGIQVANWNESRLNRQLEIEFLSGIYTDLQADKESLQRAIVFASDNIEAGNYLLSAAGFEPLDSAIFPLPDASNRPDVDAPTFLGRIDESVSGNLWSRLMVRYFPTPNDAAFSTLVATGRLGLIDDWVVVSELQSYRSQWRNLDTSQSQAVFNGQKYALSPYTRLPEEMIVRLLQDHSDLLGAVRTHLEYVAIHRNLLSETLVLTEALLDMVENSLAIKH